MQQPSESSCRTRAVQPEKRSRSDKPSHSDSSVPTLVHILWSALLFSSIFSDKWLLWGLNLMLKICWPLKVGLIALRCLSWFIFTGTDAEPSTLSAKQMLQPCPCIRLYISPGMKPPSKVVSSDSFFPFFSPLSQCSFYSLSPNNSSSFISPPILPSQRSDVLHGNL